MEVKPSNVVVSLTHLENMRFEGKSQDGFTTLYDNNGSEEHPQTAMTPMQTLLTSLAACTAMDVVSILEKKRKTITSFSIELEGERADEYPKVYTKVHLIYKLKSEDTRIEDFERAVELSMDKYCNISAMFRNSGCELSRELILQ